MAAIGSTWASGSWVSVGGWAAGTWAAVSASPGITDLDDDTTTAFTKDIATINSSLWMNERIRAHLNTAYGTTEEELQPLLARYLRDLKS
jgi:hypothetical protein